MDKHRIAGRDALEAFQRVQARDDMDSSRIVFGGVSQDVGLAVQLALRGQPVSARGFVAVAGGGRAETLELLFGDAARREVRGVLITE